MTFYELFFDTEIKDLPDDYIIYCGNMSKEWHKQNHDTALYDLGNIYDFELVTNWMGDNPHTLGRIREEYKNLNPKDTAKLQMDIEDGYVFQDVVDYLIVSNGVVFFT